MSAAEAAIRQSLKGHHYSMQWDDDGCKVVDLKAKKNNIPAPVPQVKSQPDLGSTNPWTDEQLIQLVELKRMGLSLNQISSELNKDPEVIWRKWQRRADWRDRIIVPRTTEIGLHEIVDAVCSAAGVSTVDFKSQRRKKIYCLARQIYYWIAKRLTTKSFPQIGKHGGNKDHATVMHGYGKIERTRQEHAALIAAVLADLQIDLKTLDGQE